jgi:hypothetical protein
MPISFVWLNAIMFVACLPYLGFPLWKAAIIAIIAAICTYLSYGAQWVSRIGFGMLSVCLAIWIGLLPSVREWPEYLRTAKNLSGLASLESRAQQQAPERYSTGTR